MRIHSNRNYEPDTLKVITKVLDSITVCNGVMKIPQEYVPTPEMTGVIQGVLQFIQSSVSVPRLVELAKNAEHDVFTKKLIPILHVVGLDHINYAGFKNKEKQAVDMGAVLLPSNYVESYHQEPGHTISGVVFTMTLALYYRTNGLVFEEDQFTARHRQALVNEAIFSRFWVQNAKDPKTVTRRMQKLATQFLIDEELL